MSNFSNIKKRLSMSTTMPIGAAGGADNSAWLMGSSTHNHNGSCCGHDHTHDNERDVDHTKPTGSCC